MKVKSLVIAVAVAVVSYQGYKLYDDKRSYDEQFVKLVSSNSEPFKIIPSTIKPLSFMTEHAVMDGPTLMASNDGTSTSQNVELQVGNLIGDSESLRVGNLDSYNLVGLNGYIFDVPVSASSARVQWNVKNGQVMFKNVHLSPSGEAEYSVGDVLVSKTFFEGAYTYILGLESIGFELVIRSESDVPMVGFLGGIQDIVFQSLQLTLQLPNEALALPILSDKLSIIEHLQKSLNKGEDPRSKRLKESISSRLVDNERLTLQLNPQRPVSLVQVKSLMELPSLKMTEFLKVDINSKATDAPTQQFDYPSISFD